MRSPWIAVREQVEGQTAEVFGVAREQDEVRAILREGSDAPHHAGSHTGPLDPPVRVRRGPARRLVAQPRIDRELTESEVVGDIGGHFVPAPPRGAGPAVVPDAGGKAAHLLGGEPDLLRGASRRAGQGKRRPDAHGVVAVRERIEPAGQRPASARARGRELLLHRPVGQALDHSRRHLREMRVEHAAHEAGGERPRPRALALPGRLDLQEVVDLLHVAAAEAGTSLVRMGKALHAAQQPYLVS